MFLCSLRCWITSFFWSSLFQILPELFRQEKVRQNTLLWIFSTLQSSTGDWQQSQIAWILNFSELKTGIEEGSWFERQCLSLAHNSSGISVPQWIGSCLLSFNLESSRYIENWKSVLYSSSITISAKFLPISGIFRLNLFFCQKLPKVVQKTVSLSKTPSKLSY